MIRPLCPSMRNIPMGLGISIGHSEHIHLKAMRCLRRCAHSEKEDRIFRNKSDLGLSSSTLFNDPRIGGLVVKAKTIWVP